MIDLKIDGDGHSFNVCIDALRLCLSPAHDYVRQHRRPNVIG